MTGRPARILIRCDGELFVRFKRAAADYKSYAELTAKLLDVYERSPEARGIRRG